MTGFVQRRHASEEVNEMKIKVTRLIATALALGLWSSVPAGGLKMIQHEDAIEANSVEFMVGPSGNGRVVVRACDTCKPVRLKVTSETKAYEDGNEVPMGSLGGQTKKTAVVFFQVKDGSVTRITW
jgi:hypothetical protein